MVSGGSESADSEQMSEGSGFNTGSNISGGINLGQNTSESLGIGAGGGSGSSSGTASSGSSGSSQSQDNVWGEQSPFLGDVYQQAQGMFNQQQPQLQQEGQFAGDYTRQAQNSGMGAWQNQLSDQNVNSYTDQMKQSVARDAQNAQNQMLGSMDARAAASGMSGGARHGQAIGEGMRGINDSMLSNQANIGFQAEEAQRGRQMQALGMSPQMAQMGSAGFDPINQQWSGVNNYAGAIGGPTTLGSSSSDSNAWSESQNQSDNSSWNDTFNAAQSQGQNLGFNFGLGQNYGENANMSEGDSSSSGWNAGFQVN